MFGSCNKENFTCFLGLLHGGMVMIMSQRSTPIVLIPARMASTRLPNKPLVDIAGVPMIVQVWRRAKEADIGPVVVACGEKKIFEVIRDAGGDAVLTDSNHPSGSDRIYEALTIVDEYRKFDLVVNLQGDLPTIDRDSIRAVLTPFEVVDCDISTLVVDITKDEEKTNPDVVKVAIGFVGETRIGRALYFSRMTVPSGEGTLFHHIGIYAYRRAALERFVSLPVGVLEQRERLEQLRALENGMRIYAARVDTCPIGVDTPIDLESARKILVAP